MNKQQNKKRKGVSNRMRYFFAPGEWSGALLLQVRQGALTTETGEASGQVGGF
ncbi:hypothetical protein [Paenibacillus sp. SER-28]